MTSTRGSAPLRSVSGLWSLVLVGLLVAAGTGCSSEESVGDGEELTPTESARRSAHPRAAKYLIRAQEASERGVYNAALALTDSALAYEPDLADIYFLRGRIYTKMQRMKRAEESYRRVVELDSTYAGGWLNLGINDVRQGDLKQAVRHLDRARGHDPTSEAYLEMGRAYSELGRPDSAEWAYRKSLELDSTNATAYMWLGQLYEETGDMERAVKLSRRGLQLDSGNLDYRYILGSQLSRLGETEEAIRHLRPVAEARPWHHGAQYNLGQALRRVGREEEADRYFSRTDTAQTLQDTISSASERVSEEPRDPANWIRMGDLMRSMERYEEAMESYRVAASLDAGNLYLQNNIANTALAMGDTAQAIQRYRAVLRTDSTLADVWVNLGAVYGNQGRFEMARDAWRNALELDPDHPTARRFISRVDRMLENR